MTDKALIFATATPDPDDQHAMQEYLPPVLPLPLGSGGNMLAWGFCKIDIVLAKSL